jgi:hypothetical protein
MNKKLESKIWINEGAQRFAKCALKIGMEEVEEQLNLTCREGLISGRKHLWVNCFSFSGSWKPAGGVLLREGG